MTRTRESMLTPSELEEFSGLNRGAIVGLVAVGVIPERGSSSRLDALVLRSMKHIYWSEPSRFRPSAKTTPPQGENSFARKLAHALRDAFREIHRAHLNNDLGMPRWAGIFLDTGEVRKIRTDADFGSLSTLAQSRVWACIPILEWYTEAERLFPTIYFEEPVSRLRPSMQGELALRR